jgi:hypothetical protein
MDKMEAGPEERRAAMRVVKDHLRPQLAELEEVARHEPREAWREAEHLAGEALELVHIKRENPELYDKTVAFLTLETRSLELAQAATIAKGEARQKLRRSLAQVLEKAFTAKQQMLQMEIQAMDADLQQLRELVKKREARRKAIIDRRMRELVDDRDDDLDW